MYFFTQSISLSNILQPPHKEDCCPSGLELLPCGIHSKFEATHLLAPIFKRSRDIGGAEEDRTPDPLLAKQVLSQLSYSPMNVVGLGRFELPTSPLSGVRSNQLSYRPVKEELEAHGSRATGPQPPLRVTVGLEKSFEDQVEHAAQLSCA
jgi:hypothetical protein